MEAVFTFHVLPIMFDQTVYCTISVESISCMDPFYTLFLFFTCVHACSVSVQFVQVDFACFCWNTGTTKQDLHKKIQVQKKVCQK